MSKTDYHEYSYDGPVKEFDRIVCNRWVAKTYAPTAKKALSNLAFQFKKEFNRATTAKITLPGEIRRLNGEERAS
jgi:hypothetical protein